MTKTKSWGVLILLSVLFITGRIGLYGMLMDSVAARDTSSYFSCAGADFTKVEAYECNRSATIPFFISIFNPEVTYDLTVVSEPFFGSAAQLAVQPGTESLVIFQTLLSIFSWLIFTLTIVSLLHHELSKILAMILLFGFAFVPQIADWDSILLSESLSFSFFILMITFMIHFLRAIFQPGSLFARLISAFLFLVSAGFWLFTRDTNAYFIALLAIVFLLIVILSTVRTHRFQGLSLLLSICLMGGFVFHQVTFRASERWMVPFLNNMAGNVFPYPDRVAFFEGKGMPVNDQILSQTGSAEYNTLSEQSDFMDWAREDGLSTYTKFLIDRPLWSSQQVYLNLDAFFEENVQPFFYGDPDEKPHWADQIGNFLHPLSSAVIWIDLILLLILMVYAFRRKDAASLTFMILSFLLTAGGAMLMAVAYLGEVRSIWRHVLCGVMPLRLALWIQLVAILDQALETPPALPVISRFGGSSLQSDSGKIRVDQIINNSHSGNETGE